MATRVELDVDLDQVVAARFARPAVDRIRDEVVEEARRRAPAAKTWVTMQDERVRGTHVETDGQMIPANLRYQLPSVRGAGYDLAREPRDGALPIEQRINCRCVSFENPEVLAQSIRSGPSELRGTNVQAEVDTRFHRAAESEFGTSEDPAARFMRDALREVAARTRARPRR